MKIIKWLDENLEEALMVLLLLAMTLIMGVQVFHAMRLACRCRGLRS